MEERIRVTGARYQQIASDIAAKIVDCRYEIGDKIYARSLIASQYSVSAETARKAVAILADLNIVDTVRGSGVIIKSYDNAVAFLKHSRDLGTVDDLKRNAMDCLSRITKEGNELRDAISELVDRTDRFRALNPLAPFSILIRSGAKGIGESVASLNFWQKTQATVVAIRREDSLILSPGPCAEFEAGDTVYFVGEEECVDRVSVLFTEPSQEAK